METRKQVSTAHTMVRTLCAFVRVHDWVVTGLIGIVDLEGTVGIGDSDKATIVVELEEVSLAEAVNNSYHGQFIGFEVECLVDGIIGNLEGEWVEATIRDNLYVLKSTEGNLRGGRTTKMTASLTIGGLFEFISNLLFLTGYEYNGGK